MRDVVRQVRARHAQTIEPNGADRGMAVALHVQSYAACREQSLDTGVRLVSGAAPASVVVFGAGETGRRALARLRADGGAEIVAFADNATDRQGTTFEGLPVVAPAAVRDSAVDRVVVASHGWKQIVPQLRALGVPFDRIQLYRLCDDRVQGPLGAPADGGARLLLLTDECVSPSHGTGALILRHFADYPQDLLLHAYLRERGECALPHSYRVAAGEPAAAAALDVPLTAEQLIETIELGHGPIDVVYSNFFGDEGLAFLRDLAHVLDPAVPIVHHALDCIVQDEGRFDALLSGLAPRLSRLWAIGPSIAQRLARPSGVQVPVVSPFSTTIYPTWKTEQRALDDTFTAVVTGNIHDPVVFTRLREVWAHIRRECGVPPIRWFAHPATARQVEQAGVQLGPDIEYCGFAVGRFLHEQLCAADMAILPFNLTDEPKDPIARYSIPSRLIDYMNAGLPVFAAAGRDTDAYRYMTGNGVAVCSTIADQATFADQLLRFIKDRNARHVIGHAARRFAVQHCDVAKYSQWLRGEFAALQRQTVRRTDQRRVA